MRTIQHPFPPLYYEDSQLLILGSFPSVKSREQLFFYGHPQNRFWKVLSLVFDDTLPVSISEKKIFLQQHHIALWDVIYQCDIEGSSDSSIRNVIPTDLQPILEHSKIQHIYCNGKTSGAMFTKYQQKVLHREAITLPSTSPANAAWSLEKLVHAWKCILSP